MKKRTIVMGMLLITSFTTLRVNAKIWRVNNNANAPYGSNFGGTAAYPVFQQLFGTPTNSANGYGLVLDGDTVHLEGSTIEYTGGNLTKRLVVIGAGYFLNENPNTSNNMLLASIGHIQLNAGSAGSQLIGLHVRDGNGIIINVSNVLVKRCKIDVDITLDNGISDIQIVQNFFSFTGPQSIIQDNVNNFPTNVIFNNNIVLGPLVLTVGYAMLECKNNVFAGLASAGNPTVRMYAGSFQNNIMTNPAATTDINGVPGSMNPINVTYNTGSSSAQFGNGTGNIVIPNMAASLFVASGTSDGKYQLQPGSATGNDGTTERGAFGGSAVTSRYTLSGLAPIPLIYEINTSGVATPSGLNVNIKARTIQ